MDYLIYHQVSHLKKVLKDKLSISVGVTNVGKLGDEPYYRDIMEFEKDMGVLKGTGIENFCLFSLDGITEEGKLLDFLNIMEKAKPYKPEKCNYVIRNEIYSGLLFNVGKLYYKFRH